jgi:NAD+ kinase
MNEFINIKNIKLFVNDNPKSLLINKKLIKLLEQNNFNIVNDNFDLGIAIGGDGTFLKMVHDSNYNSNIYYIGINTGTLGFAQEINGDNINEFVGLLKTKSFKIENIGILETKIDFNNNIHNFYSLNEVVIRNTNLKLTRLNVVIDNHKLEDFAGDGLLISSSFGSTGHNLSIGGAIVYNTFPTLQITPIAPLNSKCYRNILNSIIIPQNIKIELEPINDNNLLITSDGDNNNFNNIKKIDIILKDKTIKCLRCLDYNFIKKVNEKLI